MMTATKEHCMTVRGITLEVGSVVLLSLDGTLVYVESTQPTFAAVVALPEQLKDRADDRVFTPGKVGAKKISPFSTTDRVLAVSELTPRNREFIGTYEKLREQHGPHYVQRTPEEEAAMSVKKITQQKNARGPATSRVSKRAQKRAVIKNLQIKCTACSEQRGHPNHPSDHEFVPPALQGSSQPEEAAPKRTPRQPKAASAPAARYTLVNPDLTSAKAQPRGDKFNDGNRSHRVVLALAGLPGSAGSLDEVIAALCADGKTPPANPAKVVRRTLNQLTKVEFGSCVTTTGGDE
jgi:hypothetical protein